MEKRSGRNVGLARRRRIVRNVALVTRKISVRSCCRRVRKLGFAKRRLFVGVEVEDSPGWEQISVIAHTLTVRSDVTALTLKIYFDHVRFQKV